MVPPPMMALLRIDRSVSGFWITASTYDEKSTGLGTICGGEA